MSNIFKRNIKIVAMFMFHEWYPDLWRKCFSELSTLVDDMYIRIDSSKTPPEVIDELQNKTECSTHIEIVDHNFNAVVWREGLLRMLDPVKPDIVIALDSDEIFDTGIIQEIQDFYQSDKRAMMCSFNPCIGNDGRKLPIYPSKPHMKIFKWEPDLSFVPYMGFAQVTQYANKRELVWKAKTKINHYCMWTKEMEMEKRVEVKKRYASL